MTLSFLKVSVESLIIFSSNQQRLGLGSHPNPSKTDIDLGRTKNAREKKERKKERKKEIGKKGRKEEKENIFEKGRENSVYPQQTGLIWSPCPLACTMKAILRAHI